jgi:plastocyanin
MRPRALLLGVVGFAVAFVLSLAVTAAIGDQQITAVFHDEYGTPTVTIDQGQSVSFQNGDIDTHNVTASQTDANGNPLFSSTSIGSGKSAVVSGTQYLHAGTYTFFCTLHPFMQGTLVVTSQGTPQTPPGQTAPTTSTSTTPTPAPAHTPPPKHKTRHRKRCTKHCTHKRPTHHTHRTGQ